MLKSLELAKAIALASDVFKDEVDKSGEPYILHCLAVMNNVKKWNDRDIEIAAVLHDVIEDTNVTIELLRSMGFNERSIKMIQNVTFPKGCSDEEYMTRILKICEDQDSIKLKMADIEHNSLILRLKGISDKDLKRITKYHRSYGILEIHLRRK